MRINGGAERIKYSNGKLIIDVSAVEDDIKKIMAYIAKGKKVSIDIKRERRSNDANDYCWVLCQKLAEKLSDDGVTYTSEQIYRHAIRQTGEPTYLPIRDDAVNAWLRNWRSKGVGWIADKLGPSKLNGYTKIVTYQGSSTYDSKEMSRLIDFLVEECQEQGIETRPRAYVNALLDEWSGKNG